MTIGPRVKFWLRLALGLGLLALILSQVDFSRLTARWGPQLLLPVLGATGCLLIIQAVSALRWKWIIGPDAPRWSYLFHLYLVGTFFSVFMPTSIGGDAVRVTATAKAIGRPGDAILSVLIDRLMGVAAMLVYVLIGLLTAPRPLLERLAASEWSVRGGLLLLAGLFLLVILIASRSSRVRPWVRQAIVLGRRLRASPGVLVGGGLLSFIVQAFNILMWAVLAAGVGLDIPLGLLVLTVPIVTLGAFLPITFSGLGLREGLWVLLLSPHVAPAADVVAYSLLYFLVFLLAGGVGGLLFVIRGLESKPSEALSG